MFKETQANLLKVYRMWTCSQRPLTEQKMTICVYFTRYCDLWKRSGGPIADVLAFPCASISWVPRRENVYWAGRITGLVCDYGTARATPRIARYNWGMQKNMCSTMCLWWNEGYISYRLTRIQKSLMSFSFCHNTLEWEDQSWVGDEVMLWIHLALN